MVFSASCNASETEIIDAATLNNVFPSRIVINNCRGVFNRLIIYLSLKFLLFCPSFFILSEKSATSEPEKTAENKSRAIKIIS